MMGTILTIPELLRASDDIGLSNFRWLLKKIQAIRRKKGEENLKRKRDKGIMEEGQSREGKESGKLLISLTLNKVAKELGDLNLPLIIDLYTSTPAPPPSHKASILLLKGPRIQELANVPASDFNNAPV